MMKQSENRTFFQCETLFRYMPSVSLAMSSTPRVKPSKRRALLAVSEKPYKPSPVRRRWREAPDEVKCQVNTARVADNHPFMCLMKKGFAFGRLPFVVRQKEGKTNQGYPLNPARQADDRPCTLIRYPRHTPLISRSQGGKEAPVGASCAKRVAFCSLGCSLVRLRLSRLLTAYRIRKRSTQF